MNLRFIDIRSKIKSVFSTLKKPANKQLYIHIGIHKTGTTTIQNMLVKNKYYWSDAGLCYPSTCLNGAHHNLPWELLSDSRWQAKNGTLKRLKREIERATYPKYIISSEDISNFSQEHIEILHKEFEKFNPKIIIYIRNQFDLIMSSWSSLIRKGNTKRSFEEHYNYCIKNKLNKLDYSILLSNWANIFGKENLIVKIYTKELGFDLHKGFMDLFNIVYNLKELKLKERLNISLSFQELNVLRAVNLISQEKRTKLRRQADNFFEASNRKIARDYFEKEALF